MEYPFGITRNLLRILRILGLSPLSLFIYLFIPFISVNIPSIVFGYTYSDVENYIAAHPAPSGCIYWIEEVSTLQGDGYKVWRNCGSTKRFEKTMTFTGARYSSPYGCSVCYKCNGDGKAYMTLYGFVYYAFTALIEKETFCDGSVREVVTEANYG